MRFDENNDAFHTVQWIHMLIPFVLCYDLRNMDFYLLKTVMETQLVCAGAATERRDWTQHWPRIVPAFPLALPPFLPLLPHLLVVADDCRVLG